jgi:hypothetical protein
MYLKPKLVTGAGGAGSKFATTGIPSNENLENEEGKDSEKSINKIKATITKTIMKGKNIRMDW